jgi:CDP-diacylglycerol---glycerol-3-phosphate 3-phosphatidyltransferase
VNLANKITLSRIPATFLFMGALFWDTLPWHTTIALGIFAVACLTDTIDGTVARRMKIVSPFGIFFDPVADKILIGGAFICLVGLGIFPAWAVVLLLSREFAVTGLRMVAADQKVVLTAETGGKLKTFVHAFTVNYFLIRLSLIQDFKCFTTPISECEVYFFLGICLILSLYTGAVYFFKNARLLNP